MLTKPQITLSASEFNALESAIAEAVEHTRRAYEFGGDAGYVYHALVAARRAVAVIEKLGKGD
jgi:hypothetical protein